MVGKLFVNIFGIIAPALLGAGCAPASAAIGKGRTGPPPSVERIVYSIGPCHGTCPAYTVSVDAAGRAVFEGERFTKVADQSVLHAPLLFSKLRKILAPIRPTGTASIISADNCVRYATDQQTVKVIWEERGRTAQTFSFDLGCHDERFSGFREVLRRARRAMKIDALVGHPTDY